MKSGNIPFRRDAPVVIDGSDPGGTHDVPRENVSIMEFEWDLRKAERNRARHGVSFGEAATVFADPLGWAFPDPDHSQGENRYVLVGMSARRRILMVAHTDRDDRTRIISAREATRQERRFYEESSQG
jgi:uncharacterized DUF497 family protein